MLILEVGDMRVVIARKLSYLDPNKTVREVIEEAMKTNQMDYKGWCDFQLLEWDRKCNRKPTNEQC